MDNFTVIWWGCRHRNRSFKRPWKGTANENNKSQNTLETCWKCFEFVESEACLAHFLKTCKYHSTDLGRAAVITVQQATPGNTAGLRSPPCDRSPSAGATSNVLLSGAVDTWFFQEITNTKFSTDQIATYLKNCRIANCNLSFSLTDMKPAALKWQRMVWVTIFCCT